MFDQSPSYPEPTPIDEKLNRREALSLRLEDGLRRIDEAELAGRDIAAWERFWFELLHEYEAVCDDLLEAA